MDHQGFPASHEHPDLLDLRYSYVFILYGRFPFIRPVKQILREILFIFNPEKGNTKKQIINSK
jgi:hypothetical protein